MMYTRRDVGRVALATAFASRFGSELMAAAKPNSRIKGVQIGCITYSFRSMTDQSAEATLKYIIDSGISAVELMATPITDWARKKGKWDSSPAAAAAAAANTNGTGGRRPGGGDRVERPTWAPVPSMQVGWGNNQASGQWNGQQCPAPRGAGPGGFGGGRRAQTTEQRAAAEADRKWRLALPMDIFKDLKKLYNDAGVTIYAVKDLPLTTEEDLDWTYTVGRTLGATHVTMELPAGANAKENLIRFGEGALRNKMLTAYHTHQQGSMTAFDEAFEISRGNMSNIDFGHMLTNPNAGGSPMDFLNKHHSRICSVHIKDRTTPAHCNLNLPFGQGETPLKEIFELISKNKWPIPCSIEQEYDIPQDSDAVKEVAKCLEYCRRIMA